MAMTKRRIAVLGSTGSIGSQALMVARLHADRFRWWRWWPPLQGAAV